MLLRAAGDLNINIARSFMVGDKPSDIKAGKRAGCRTILLMANPMSDGLDPVPDYVAAGWPEVLEHILRHIGGTT